MACVSERGDLSLENGVYSWGNEGYHRWWYKGREGQVCEGGTAI